MQFKAQEDVTLTLMAVRGPRPLAVKLLLNEFCENTSLIHLGFYG